MTDQDVIRFWCDELGWHWNAAGTYGSAEPFMTDDNRIHASINDLTEAVRVWYRENKDEDVEISDEYLSTEWFFGGPLAFLRAAREVVE